MGRKPTKDQPAFKREYRKTGNIKTSMIASGYTETSANMGLAALQQNLQKFVLTRKRKLDKYAKLGETLTAQQQENTVRGALLANVAAGKDQAVNSLKLLGQDRRVSMFTPESATGVIVIQAAQVPAIEGIPRLPAVIDGTESK